jgi:uncharacterized protein YciI/uncharacterized protein YndB with AHSA1/START domain
MAELTPVRREVLVDADVSVAFEVFTDRLSSWWPLAELSVYGAGSSVAFRDGVIVETAPGRPDAVWGTVTDWRPPSSLAFTWHPGSGPERASRVSVVFVPSGPQTLVRLEHAGWERLADPAAARGEYDHGWPKVLGAFRQSFEPTAPTAPTAPDEEPAWTWVALVHRPGPSAPAVGSVCEDPRFGEHIAFIERMRDAGHLVAAGPLADERDAGMTVLRLPGADRLGDATRLARIDDTSVAGGLFEVTVRPWNVVMHTSPRADPTSSA